MAMLRGASGSMVLAQRGSLRHSHATPAFRLARLSMMAAQQKQQKQQQGGKGGGGGGKGRGGGRPSITPRAEDYSQWYQDIISFSDLADSSPVKGCMVIKPNGMALWDAIRSELDGQIRDTGAQNAYFPLFIPVNFLSKESDHVEGFAKECAVVTHHRLRSSESGGVEVDPTAKLEAKLSDFGLCFATHVPLSHLFLSPHSCLTLSHCFPHT